MQLLILCVVMAFVVVSSVALSAPDEAYGTVSNIVDGNTFDIRIEQNDWDLEDVIRVRLADIDCPEVDTQEGKKAQAFTYQWIWGEYVYLDLDNKTGKDRSGRWAAVCYLEGDEPIEIGQNFNKMLVDAGHASVKDDPNNEFDPEDWWIQDQSLIEVISETITTRMFDGSANSNRYHYSWCQWV